MGLFDFLKKDKDEAKQEVAPAAEEAAVEAEPAAEEAAAEGTGNALMDMIYGGSDAVIGLTEGAVAAAIEAHGEDAAIAFPDTAYFLPTIYAATGVKVQNVDVCVDSMRF